MKLRDTNDFERKIFSSTPDTSMYAVPVPVINPNSLINEYEIFDGDDYNYYEDEQDVSIQLENSSKKEKNPKKIPKNSKVQISSDLYTEKDEDTLNNMTDIEN